MGGDAKGYDMVKCVRPGFEVGLVREPSADCDGGLAVSGDVCGDGSACGTNGGRKFAAGGASEKRFDGGELVGPVASEVGYSIMVGADAVRGQHIREVGAETSKRPSVIRGSPHAAIGEDVGSVEHGCVQPVWDWGA